MSAWQAPRARRPRSSWWRRAAPVVNHTVQGMYGTPEAGTCTAHVLCVGPRPSCPAPLIRTARRPWDVHVSLEQRGDEQHEEEERSAADTAGGVARAAPPPQQPPVAERHSRRLEWRYGIRPDPSPGSSPGPGPGPDPARSLGTGRGIGAGPSGGVSRDGGRVRGGARLRRDGATSLDRRHGSQLGACVHAQQPRAAAPARLRGRICADSLRT